MATRKKPFEGVLISVYYNKIVAKTNRISGLFRGKDSNLAIVGAKFNDEKSKHVITYFLDIKDLDKSIDLLSKTSNVLNAKFKDGINKSIFNDNKIINKVPFKQFSISKSAFKQVVADVSYIDDFEVERATPQLKQSIITLYDTGIDTKKLFKNIGIESNNLYINTTKGFDEIFLEMLERKWNTISFPPNINQQDFSDLFNSQFVFDNIQTIERKGYNLKHNITRKKVFISYCHNDKEIVHSITQQLEDSGANLWIDKKCIDYGDDILESVMTGIKESDLAVLFLSNSTKTQLFARRELKTIYSDVIYDRKKWFIIKLDDVDVDDIIYGLSNFLYYDYTSNQNTIDLITEILKRVKTL